MYFKISAVLSILLMAQVFEVNSEEECINLSQIWEELLVYFKYVDLRACKNVSPSLDNLTTIVRNECVSKIDAAASQKFEGRCKMALISTSTSHASLSEELQKIKTAVENNQGFQESLKKVVATLEDIQKFTTQSRSECKDENVNRIIDVCQLGTLKGALDVIIQVYTCPNPAVQTFNQIVSQLKTQK